MEAAAPNETLKSDFNLFLRDRTKLVFAAMVSLADGNSPKLDTLWTNSLPNCADEAKSRNVSIAELILEALFRPRLKRGKLLGRAQRRYALTRVIVQMNVRYSKM